MEKTVTVMELIKEYGVENIYFLIKMKPIKTYFGFISMTDSSDPDIPMLCRIDQSRHKVISNYKITLESVDQIKGIFGREHYYISDLENFVRHGNVQVFIKALN